MLVLSTKLKFLKNKFEVWNQEVFGNVHSYVTDVENSFIDVQNQIQMIGHTDPLINEENKAQSTLDDSLHKQEIFRQEKAKLRWHVDGDRNSRYFHKIIKINNKTKIIFSIRGNYH